MELVGSETRAKDQNKVKHLHGGTGMRMGLDSDTILVIKLPDPKVLRVISRSVFLALVFITFPCIGPFKGGSNGTGIDSNANSGVYSGAFNHEQLDMLLRDLSEEGLLRKSDKALIVSPGAKSVIRNLKNFSAEHMVVVMDSCLEGQSSLVFDESFDFVIVQNLATDAKFVDRMVKTGGILAFPLNNVVDQANLLREKTNYKIVYLRRYSSNIVAMRKIRTHTSVESSFAKRRLLQSAIQVNKAEALKDLEGVLLEPPRKKWLSKDSKNYSRKIKFLPQLLGDDSLEGFRRRVFVNVGLPEQRKDVTKWFLRNYPKMKQEFEVYDLNLVPEEGTSMLASTPNDISGWLTSNVREDYYVVMKAEAEAVEEMINKSTIHLVDELFLECNNQWWKVGRKKKSESKRTYWECLALYGRVKDEGVAVHQWWG